MAAARENIEKQNSSFKRMAMEEFTCSSCSKRRKICVELSNSSPGSAESVTKSAIPSHNLEAIDLKFENSEAEVCMISNGEFSGVSSHQYSKEELKLSGGGGGELGEEMESPPAPPLSTPETKTTSTTSSSLPKRGGDDAQTTPSAADIEDFFSAAEKYQQKRFAEKYNYDVVKDVPVEGRYKWIPLKL